MNYKEIELFGKKVYVVRQKYVSTNNTCLQAFCADTGEPFATLTINKGKLPKENMAYIKDYSEMSGALSQLISCGIVQEVIDTQDVPLCILNLDGITELY